MPVRHEAHTAKKLIGSEVERSGCMQIEHHGEQVREIQGLPSNVATMYCSGAVLMQHLVESLLQQEVRNMKGPKEECNMVRWVGKSTR